MLKNTIINRKAVKKIAHALGELNQQVVFVGGAIVSLYIDDASADDVRPTQDIDFSMEIVNLGELEEIRETLKSKSFHQSIEDNVICRFRYEDIKVDVMATKAIGWAPANPWFAPGFEHLIEIEVDEIVIRCLSLPYFLATKFTAFYDRGSKDPRTSKDFEDLVYLLNYTSTIKEQVLLAEKEVKNYLNNCFLDILDDSTKQEAILGNLFYEDQEYRFKKIMQLLKEITDGI